MLLFMIVLSFDFLATLQNLIQQTVIKWAEEQTIQSQELVREMFSLLHRQYNGIGEVIHDRI